MIKKILVLSTLVLFGLVNLGGCNHNKPQPTVEKPSKDITKPQVSVQQPSNDTYYPSITVTYETDPEIARSLLDKYLQHYASSEVAESERLKDYKINEIAIREKTNDGFVYTAKFSVQGFNNNTPLGAGNGVIKDNGWIEDKFMFIRVSQKDKTFTMTGMATSPF